MVHDVVIAGGGPAALAAAVACGEAGLRTLVLGGRDAPWPAAYGAWADEFEALDLGGFLDPVWPDAVVVLDDARTVRLGRRYGRVAKQRLRAHLLARAAALGVEVRWRLAREAAHDATGTDVRVDDGTFVRGAALVDATGHDPVFVRRDGGPTTWQAAVGFLGTPDRIAWDPTCMTFMDLRTDHVDDALGDRVPTFLYAMPLGDRTFLEETSLVRGPAVPYAVLLARLRRRLAHHGVRLGAVDHTEMCLIPMDTPVPDLDQRVVGFGGAASMVHPATGYQLARAFGTAPDLARALSEGLGAGRAPADVARAAWRSVWTRDDLVRHRLHRFGSQLLAALDAPAQRDFFDAFFKMPRETWSGYLAGRGDVGRVVRAMAAMLRHAGPRTRWQLIRSGTRLPGALLRAG